MNLELLGLRAPSRRLRPVAAGPFALLSLVVALLPIRPAGVWLAAVLACHVVPWLLGLREGRPGRWRLSSAGLERLTADGSVAEAYELNRVEEFAVTEDDGMLTIFHRFGVTTPGSLAEMGFDPLTFYITARRLGITTHVIDGDRSVFEDDNLPPDDEAPRALGRRGEQRLRDQEAALLAVAHEPRTIGRDDAGRLGTVATGWRRTTVLGLLVTLLSLLMVVRTALEGGLEFGGRLMGGLWALAGGVALLAARRRRLTSAPLTWNITPMELRVRHATVGEWRVRADAVAAVVVGPGTSIDPLSGRPAAHPAVATVFGHRLEVLARLPVRELDPFQLTHALDERGYQVITPDQTAARPSEYGLAGLPEIFSRVPGGRLVVDDDGIGWADGAGDVILRMPRDRIGGMELLTVDGHAWLRMYDDEGDEFLAAPLSMLRISRTDLRDAARRVQLPITDAEYDAYINAAFHGSMNQIEADVGPSPEKADTLPAAQLDVPTRTRALAYAVTAVLCELVAVLGSLWLRDDLGGFWTALSWAAPSGLVLGLAGAWLYDRNRPQLRVSSSGISSVTRLGRTEWSVTRQALGGVGIDEAEAPRLVVWSPAGRVLRRVSFPPDLTELRRACERHGLPWGPPDAGHGAAPPPEL
ncbi:MAG: YqeB family protein [Actinoallomurus sp.]